MPPGRDLLVRIIVIAAAAVAAAVSQQRALLQRGTLFSLRAAAQRRKIRHQRKRRHGNPLGVYMYNLIPPAGPPEHRLETVDVFAKLSRDPARRYSKVLTALYIWELKALADLLETRILRPRNPNATRQRRCKLDHQHRLFWCLRWLCSGECFRQEEFAAGWGKSSLHEDLPHVLGAIIEGLDFCIKWPNAAQRHRLANQHKGIFQGCVGVMDVTEIKCKRPKDSKEERDVYSAKKSGHTWKTLSACDFRGYCTYVQTGVGGGHADREQWTACPLYLREAHYFSAGQRLAADGGFRGDGPLQASLDDPGADPWAQLYNVAFQELRKFKENFYGRLKSWFPILGRRRRTFDSSKKIFMLTIHACFRLTNWLMRNRKLNYDASSNPHLLFRRFY
jgi:hypothetical protein